MINKINEYLNNGGAVEDLPIETIQKIEVWKEQKNTFQVVDIDLNVLQHFDIYAEALEYILKLGDQNKLAKINVKIQEENPVYA